MGTVIVCAGGRGPLTVNLYKLYRKKKNQRVCREALRTHRFITKTQYQRTHCCMYDLLKQIN